MPFSGQLWGGRSGNSAVNADSQRQNDLLAAPGRGWSLAAAGRSGAEGGGAGESRSGRPGLMRVFSGRLLRPKLQRRATPATLRVFIHYIYIFSYFIQWVFLYLFNLR